ncbi:MAG: F0F1 ATP synthase subunit A [Candidatus Colwellbacteria bacterium]|nr:F0F1 ATP synthase subunit A [Candidatus Colwellbacteria bacterium]
MSEISIRAEELFKIGNLPVTNSVLLGWITLVMLLVLAFFLKNNLSLIPGKLQSVFELVTEEILKLMDSVLGNRYISIRYFPLIATIFLFVLASNWMGLLPGVGSIGIFHHLEGGKESTLIPLFRAPSADLNFTIALATISVLSVNLLGVMAIGFFKHFSKFFNFSNPISFFTGVLEFISEFVKIVSFSFRLFGNVFAGEVLLVIVAFLFPYVIPVPFLFLEIFVGFIQALIFSMLTLVFVGIATSVEASH